MAMNKTVLAQLMKAKMDAIPVDQRNDQQKTFEALADAVITHIIAAATISGVAAVGLVAPPGGGPVTGSVILPPGSIT